MINFNNQAQPSTTPSVSLLLAVMSCAVFFLCLIRGTADQFLVGWPFHDVDDIMRILQVLDLMNGADWYDVTQERLNPPGGVEMHWSRLPDVPLLGVITLARNFVSLDASIVIAASFVPAFLGACFFLAFVWAVKPIVGKAGLPFAGLVCIALLIPLSAFVHGRVDHHGWQLLLAMIAAGGVFRVIMHESPTYPAAIAGVAGAFGLWVGAEAIVPIGIAMLALTLVWIRLGKPVAYSLAIFGTSLTVSSVLILPLAVQHRLLSEPVCDAFSIVSVGLSFAIALFGAGLVFVEKRILPNNWLQRLYLGAGFGVMIMAAIFAIFPGCLQSPYAGMSVESTRMISIISEAQPMWAAINTRPAVAATHLAVPLAALIIVIWGVRTEEVPERRSLWILVGVFVVGGIIFEVWQIRGTMLANSYAGFAFAGLAAKVGAKALHESKVLRRLLYKSGPALSLAALPWLASLTVGDISHFALKGDYREECNWNGAADMLRDMPAPDDKPLLIAASMDVSPVFLLLTPHDVLGAFYHRNTEGVDDTVRLLYGDERSAIEVINRRGVDIVVVCKNDRWAVRERSEGKKLFVDELTTGQVPEWLHTVSIDKSIDLFIVRDHSSEMH